MHDCFNCISELERERECETVCVCVCDRERAWQSLCVRVQLTDGAYAAVPVCRAVPCSCSCRVVRTFWVRVHFVQIKIAKFSCCTYEIQFGWQARAVRSGRTGSPDQPTGTSSISPYLIAVNN